jgi:hypothetical protein
MKHINKYDNFINEDGYTGGVGYASNMGGMGPVISPGVSSTPGVPGSSGSGDFGVKFGAHDMASKMQKMGDLIKRTKSAKKKKKLSDPHVSTRGILSKWKHLNNEIMPKGGVSIKSFSDWAKDN